MDGTNDLKLIKSDLVLLLFPTKKREMGLAAAKHQFDLGQNRTTNPVSLGMTSPEFTPF